MNDYTQNKLITISEVQSYINGIEFQKNRILNQSLQGADVSPTHDADFYMVILRRLYRIIEQHSETNSAVANLKGKFQHLYKKIKIRDHFEHEVNHKTFPQITPGITVVGGLVVNDTNPHIISGDQQWLLIDDHNSVIDLANQFVILIGQDKT